MARKSVSFSGLVCLLATVLVWLLPALTAQTSGRIFSERLREAAETILDSQRSSFLSNAGRHALGVASGRTTLPVSATADAPASVFPDIGASGLVNNPGQDEELFGSTFQSQSSVANFARNVVVAFEDLGGNPFSSFGVSYVGWSRSADGARFTDMGTIQPGNTVCCVDLYGNPRLTTNLAGELYMVTSPVFDSRPAGFQYTVAIQRSGDGGQSWDAASYPPAAGLPAIFTDRASIAVDQTRGRFSNRVYVAWMQVNCDLNCFYSIVVSHSSDGGFSFSTPAQIPLPAITFASFPEIAVGPQGNIYVVFLGLSNDYQFFVSKSADGGASFSTPLPIVSWNYQNVLFGVGFIQPQPALAVNPINGNLYVAFASHPAANDGGDIFFTSSTDNGGTWSLPIRLNDDAGTNDQFSPALAVSSLGVVEVAWYDKRNDPMNQLVDVYRTQVAGPGLFTRNRRVTLNNFLFPALSALTSGLDPGGLSLAAGAGAGQGQKFFLSWTDARRVISTYYGNRTDYDIFFQQH